MREELARGVCIAGQLRVFKNWPSCVPFAALTLSKFFARTSLLYAVVVGVPGVLVGV